jgi:hypothetical protein
MLRCSMERNRRQVYTAPLLLGLIGCMVLAGCRKERGLQEIEEEERSLDALYLTAETGKEITAPANKGVFVDEETGELCYPAYMCANPDCPGKKSGDRPFLFIHRDVLLRAGFGGKVVRDEIPPGEDPVKFIKSPSGFLAPTCPACWEVRKARSETPAQKQQFIDRARPYDLPKTAKRMKELEQEYKLRSARKPGPP